MGGWGVHKILEEELAKYKIGTIHSRDAIYILFFLTRRRFLQMILGWYRGKGQELGGYFKELGVSVRMLFTFWVK